MAHIKEDSLKPGDLVTYRNYGQLRKGTVIKRLGSDQLHVIREDGPMIGSTAWIHVDSIVTE
jgi:hypothetical protein